MSAITTDGARAAERIGRSGDDSDSDSEAADAKDNMDLCCAGAIGGRSRDSRDCTNHRAQ